MFRSASLALFVSGVLACATPLGSPEVRYVITHEAMGTEFCIVFFARDSELAVRAAEDAFERLDLLEAIYSDYDPGSELSRLSERTRGAAPEDWIAVSPELARVLARARALSEASDGAFDVTVGPLTRLWRRAVRERELPEPEALARARSSVGWRNFEVDESGARVRLLAADMRFDLGGIGVGAAIDEMLAILGAHGIESALVDGGGDIVVSAPPPGRESWRIAVRSLTSATDVPSFSLALAHAALSTSGDTQRFVELEGARYSHVVDPFTGDALTSRAGAAVVAPDGVTADALSTAACVLGPRAAMPLLSSFAGVEALVVSSGSGEEDREIVACDTPGFRRMMIAP